MPNRIAQHHVLVASAAKTENFDSTIIGVGDKQEAEVYVDVTAVSGTDPTLDLHVATSGDGDDDGWFIHEDGVFARFTATGKGKVSLLGNLGKELKLVANIGGTSTPTFTFRATLLAKN